MEPRTCVFADPGEGAPEALAGPGVRVGCPAFDGLYFARFVGFDDEEALGVFTPAPAPGGHPDGGYVAIELG